MNVKGTLRKDKKTKNLAKRLNLGEIAIIDHKDIDEIAALSLVETKIKCILNLDKSISGRYPNKGPEILHEAGILIFECEDKEIFNVVDEGEILEIQDNNIVYKEKIIGTCEEINEEKINHLLKIGYDNIENELDNFIDNTLEYAKKEKELVTGDINIPEIKTTFKNRHALVVVRGKDYKKDLLAVRNYISEVNPILIGVDGGGDALLEFGYIPDMVIGDMDSVSDKCLQSSGEIIVHAYPNGKAPGLKRVEELGLDSVVFPSPGTSEDIALLLAYSNEVDLIVAVGTHNSMIDFLEKGRNGMASTFLVRLKVGAKLIDAKGVNELYKSSLKPKYMIGLGLAALLPIIVIALLFPPMQELIQLIQIKLRILLGF
ncbi:putative pyrophosphokinase [Gottschalkia acidurici 9a]|uniref:Pyrophosphokinase n=1 Tax=Gottschalkia acidurici (strain ATCC 7906 / DSM 604 / BCRC 14475 / CIP 104303 / KCTC 5404 / NCIMB 10678 / 9a) TaxID=1128398 RepID=K0B051_GOTA9|nr:putative cytokinetic ring protein SteA [Gottschalkia acidurici]AFS78407.1 putative pyrophosphokinase [Gottschalkia acidurici 9a]